MRVRSQSLNFEAPVCEPGSQHLKENTGMGALNHSIVMVNQLSGPGNSNMSWYHIDVFGNCQIGAIGLIQNILDYCKNKEERISALRLLQITHKRSVIFNINEKYEKILEELFPPTTHIFKQRFTNTNGSAMIMYLCRTEHFQNNN